MLLQASSFNCTVSRRYGITRRLCGRSAPRPGDNRALGIQPPCSRTVMLAHFLIGAPSAAALLICFALGRDSGSGWDAGSGSEDPNFDGRSRGGGGRGSRGQAGGSRGRGGRGRGRGGRPGDELDDFFTVRDLPDLASRVERRLTLWSGATLVAALVKLAKVGTSPYADPALCRRTFDSLAGAYLPLVPSLGSPKNVTLLLWACSKLGFWDGGLAKALVHKLRDSGRAGGRSGGGQERGEGLIQQSNDRDHANLWVAMSDTSAPPSIRALAAEVLEASAAAMLLLMPEQLGPQACSNVLLSLARLEWDDSRLAHHLTACLVAKPDAGSQELANSLYALGQLSEKCGHVPHAEDLKRLGDAVVERLAQDEEDEKALLLPHTSGRGQGLQDGTHTTWKRDNVAAIQLAQMLVGCSKLRSLPPGLLPKLAAAAGRAASSVDGQMLANSLHAMAKLGCGGDTAYTSSVQQLCSAVRERLQQRPGDCVPQELANILWALEKLRTPQSQLLVRKLAIQCAKQEFRGFKPQELSNSAWALAKLEWTDQGWYEAVVAAASQPGAMMDAKPQEWSNLWYALAVVRHRPAASLLECMAGSDVLRTQCEGQACANLLWSLAVLDVYNERLVDVLADRLGQLLQQGGNEQLGGQAIANSLWALAVAGPEALSRHSGLVEGLLSEAVRRLEAGVRSGGLSEFGTAELLQLLVVQQELVHLGCGRGLDRIMAAGADSPGGLRSAARRAAEERLLGTDDGPTSLEQQLLSSLEGLQQRLAVGAANGPIVALHVKYTVQELGRRVDVLVELADSRRVAVEVLSPLCFLANQPYKRSKTGPTQLRERQLGRVFGPGGYVSIPYWEWDALRTEEGRQRYLCRLLGLPLTDLGH